MTSKPHLEVCPFCNLARLRDGVCGACGTSIGSARAPVGMRQRSTAERAKARREVRDALNARTLSSRGAEDIGRKQTSRFDRIDDLDSKATED